MNKLWRGEEREIFYFQIFCNFSLFCFFSFFFCWRLCSLSLTFFRLSLSLFSLLFSFFFLFFDALSSSLRRKTSHHKSLFVLRAWNIYYTHIVVPPFIHAFKY